MVVRCPKCTRIVPLTDLRVDWDLGNCRACGFRFAISALSPKAVRPHADTGRKPPAVSLSKSGDKIILQAATVSPIAAVALGLATVLWCGLWFLIMRGADFRRSPWGFSEFLLLLIHIFFGLVAAFLVS
jgi:hypothetical protein